MDDAVRFGALEHQVLPAAANSVDPTSGESPKTAIASIVTDDNDVDYAAALENRRDIPPDGLDFGKLWHCASLQRAAPTLVS